MRERSSRYKTTSKPLFNPDEIATAISQNLNRDLSIAKQLYGGGNPMQRFFSDVQSTACLKKYASTESDEDRLEKEAFASFLETNARMKDVNLSFPKDLDQRANKDLNPSELMLVRARWLCHWVLKDITWGELTDRVTHSGGVTLGVSYRHVSAG